LGIDLATLFDGKLFWLYFEFDMQPLFIPLFNPQH
jgi:hypothetical protein